MYPERIFLGLGIGEAMNEVPVGCGWPPFRQRVRRFEEAIQIIKLLWTNDGFSDYRGRYYAIKKAKLYTKPARPIPLYIASNGPAVAEIAGKYADGYLTSYVGEHFDHIGQVLLPALEKGAREAGRNPDLLEKAVWLAVSYDEDCDKALQSCRFWAGALLPVFLKYPVSDPREIEKHGEYVGNEQIAKRWFVASSPEEHLKNIEKYIKLGFTHIVIQSSSPDELKTIRMFGERILPYLRETYASKASGDS